MFSEISSTEYKTISAIKEEVETVNLNQYWSSRRQKLMKEIKQIPKTDKLR